MPMTDQLACHRTGARKTTPVDYIAEPPFRQSEQVEPGWAAYSLGAPEEAPQRPLGQAELAPKPLLGPQPHPEGGFLPGARAAAWRDLQHLLHPLRGGPGP